MKSQKFLIILYITILILVLNENSIFSKKGNSYTSKDSSSFIKLKRNLMNKPLNQILLQTDTKLSSTIRKLKLNKNKVKKANLRKKTLSMIRDINLNYEFEENKFDVNLKYDSDGMLMAEVFIGNPSEKHYMLVDSGSANFVLFSKRILPKYYSADNSKSSKKLDSLIDYFKDNLSNPNDIDNISEINDDSGNKLVIDGDNETKRDIVHLEYGAGEINCVGDIDKVCLKSNENCVDMLFLESVKQSELISNSDFDGILGLSIGIQGLDYKSNILNTLYDNNLIKNKAYSLYISDNKNDSSILTIGGYNKKYFDKMMYFKLYSDEYWEIEISKVMIGDLVLPICNLNICTVLLDSGTKKLGLKKDNFDKVMSFTKSKIANSTCFLQNIRIFLKDIEDKEIELTLEPEYFSKNCEIEILSLEALEYNDRDIFLLGNQFMKKYYSLFDKDKNIIGLALSKTKN